MMKPRDFLVDITISMPRGEKVEDWSYVGHMFLDVNEESVRHDRLDIAVKVSEKIQEWLEKNPNVHDCMDNVVQTEEEYMCGVCSEELTPEVEKMLKLSAERRVNERATAIVDV